MEKTSTKKKLVVDRIFNRIALYRVVVLNISEERIIAYWSKLAVIFLFVLFPFEFILLLLHGSSNDGCCRILSIINHPHKQCVFIKFKAFSVELPFNSTSYHLSYSKFHSRKMGTCVRVRVCVKVCTQVSCCLSLKIKIKRQKKKQQPKNQLGKWTVFRCHIEWKIWLFRSIYTKRMSIISKSINE